MKDGTENDNSFDLMSRMIYEIYQNEDISFDKKTIKLMKKLNVSKNDTLKILYKDMLSNKKLYLQYIKGEYGLQEKNEVRPIGLVALIIMTLLLIAAFTITITHGANIFALIALGSQAFIGIRSSIKIMIKNITIKTPEEEMYNDVLEKVHNYLEKISFKKCFELELAEEKATVKEKNEDHSLSEEENYIYPFIDKISELVETVEQIGYDGYRKDIKKLMKLSKEYIDYKLKKKESSGVELTLEPVTDTTYYIELAKMEDEINSKIKGHKIEKDNIKHLERSLLPSVKDECLEILTR